MDKPTYVLPLDDDDLKELRSKLPSGCDQQGRYATRVDTGGMGPAECVTEVGADEPDALTLKSAAMIVAGYLLENRWIRLGFWFVVGSASYFAAALLAQGV
jgi:hypothetical protein